MWLPPNPNPNARFITQILIRKLDYRVYEGCIPSEAIRDSKVSPRGRMIAAIWCVGFQLAGELQPPPFPLSQSPGADRIYVRSENAPLHNFEALIPSFPISVGARKWPLRLWKPVRPED